MKYEGIMINKTIQASAKFELKRLEYIETCIKAMICPKCGSGLGKDTLNNAGGDKYCKVCDISYS